MKKTAQVVAAIERGKLVRKRREQLRLTISRLAEDVGCTRQTISRIEKGQSLDIKGSILVGLNRVLDISPAALVLGVTQEAVDLLKAVRIFEVTNDLEFTPQERIALAEKIRGICGLQDTEISQDVVNHLLPILA